MLFSRALVSEYSLFLSEDGGFFCVDLLKSLFLNHGDLDSDVPETDFLSSVRDKSMRCCHL